MSIPITASQRQALATFAYNFPNWSNTTPFTYQDGWTAAKMLESLVAYIDKVLVPYIDGELQQQITDWTSSIRAIIAQLETSMDEFDESVDAKITQLMQQVANAVDQIINDSVEVQDAVVKQLVETDSLTRGAMDNRYVRPSSVDALVATLIATATATRNALDARYQAKFYIDPVAQFGAVGDGTTDDTAALQAAIDAIPTSGGAVMLAGRSFRITDTLVFKSNTQLIGIAAKSSTLLSNMDKPSIRAMGGEGQVIRNIRVSNTFTGARTTYDIAFVSPTKPVLDFVEINLPNGNLAKGGISFIKDAAVPGNSFMPELNNVWIRNGHLYVEGVTDGHFNGGWVWAPYTNAPGSVEMRAIADGWTFQGVDVVPTINAGYYFNQCNNENIIGGYLDGGRPEFLLGHGIHAVSSGRLTLTGFMLYNSGKSGIRFENTNGCNISGLRFFNSNKRDGSFPDIDLVNSSFNNFVNTEHASWTARTNKGQVFREDSTSTANNLDYAIIDTTNGNQYLSRVVVANPNTLGEHCKPYALFPAVTRAPRVIIPPVCTAVGMPASPGLAWGIANRAVFHLFEVNVSAPYRYANVFIQGSFAGNLQTAVVRLDDDNTYERVMHSGTVAIVSGMSASVDMGATVLVPGRYALVVWMDTATPTLALQTNEFIRATRSAGEATLVGGIPTTGTAPAFNAPRAIGGMSLSVVVS